MEKSLSEIRTYTTIYLQAKNSIEMLNFHILLCLYAGLLYFKCRRKVGTIKNSETRIDIVRFAVRSEERNCLHMCEFLSVEVCFLILVDKFSPL